MFRRVQRPTNARGEEENPFLLSFSDLMASLLAIFILALIVMMVQLHRKKQEVEQERQKIKLTLVELLGSLQEIEKTQDGISSALSGISLREQSLAGILEGVQRDLKERGIEVVVAENGSVLRIPEQALHFELGQYDIPLEFQPSVNAIGQALQLALQKDETRALLDTVFIEGHTDAARNTREMGNWGLSTYRAISLWKFWTETPGQCVALRDLKTPPRDASQLGRLLISVSGYAETRPTGAATPALLPQKAAEGENSADRRIDIRFTLAAGEKQELQDVKEQLKEMKDKTRNLIEKLKGDE
jgi:flagellar motor protein MotB